MKRLHLIELEDSPVLPAAIRNGGTDFLDFWFAKIGFYRKLTPAFRDFLNITNYSKMNDLCSGGGGGTLDLYRGVNDLKNRQELHLSDAFPNAAGIDRINSLKKEGVFYKSESVNVLDLQVEQSQLYTMAGALHHFKPDDVRNLIARIVKGNGSFFIVDIAASPVMRQLPLLLLPIPFLINIFMLTIISLLMIIWICPFRLSRLFFAYFIPLIPLMNAWDGTVSALRAYTPDELLTLAKSIPEHDRYIFEAGIAGMGLYFSGRPKD